MPGTATEVLKEAESELVTKEVAEQGGVVRGGTAAKVQVCNIVQYKLLPDDHLGDMDNILSSDTALQSQKYDSNRELCLSMMPLDVLCGHKNGLWGTPF